MMLGRNVEAGPAALMECRGDASRGKLHLRVLLLLEGALILELRQRPFLDSAGCSCAAQFGLQRGGTL